MFWSWPRTPSPFSSINQIFSPRLLTKYRASVRLLWYILEYTPTPRRRCLFRSFFDIHLIPWKFALGLFGASASLSSSRVLASSDSSDSSSSSSSSATPASAAPTGGLIATPAVETRPSGESAPESLTSSPGLCLGRSREPWSCSRPPFPFRCWVMIGDGARRPVPLASSSSFRCSHSLLRPTSSEAFCSLRRFLCSRRHECGTIGSDSLSDDIL